MQNVTPIDSLPELEDLEGPQPFAQAVRGDDIRGPRYEGMHMLPPNEAERYSKFIRDSHRLPAEAGMAPNPPQETFELQPIQPQQFAEPIESGAQPKYKLPDGSPHCLDIANHMAACPVCTRCYSNDKTIYIIAIVVLAIICILLLKRVLDV